jgi:hypothetical protein
VPRDKESLCENTEMSWPGVEMGAEGKGNDRADESVTVQPNGQNHASLPGWSSF